MASDFSLSCTVSYARYMPSQASNGHAILMPKIALLKKSPFFLHSQNQRNGIMESERIATQLFTYGTPSLFPTVAPILISTVAFADMYVRLRSVQTDPFISKGDQRKQTYTSFRHREHVE